MIHLLTQIYSVRFLYVGYGPIPMEGYINGRGAAFLLDFVRPNIYSGNATFRTMLWEAENAIH